MRTLIGLTKYQFVMLLRNRGLLVGSLGVAVVSILIFGTLFGDGNARPLSVGLVDQDKSPASGQVVAAMKSSGALTVAEGEREALLNDLKQGRHAAVVVLTPGFGAGLARGGSIVELYVDESDLVGASMSRVTVNAIFDEVSKRAAGFKETVQIDEQRITTRQVRTIDFLTPGMLGLTIMFANMPVGLALMAWRERGTLKRLSATPLKAWQLIGSQIVSHLALSFAQVAIILGIAATVFNVQIDASWLFSIAVFVVAGAFSIIALGYAVGNFVQKREAAQSLVTLISLPMMFLSASYFPVDPPPFLQPLVEILPLTHLNRAFRQIMLNDAALGSLLLNLGVLLAFGAVLLALSVRTFRWSWSK